MDDPTGASRTRRIFVSYARDDESVIKPVVELLRFSGSSVFRDVDDIAPGRKWRLEIAKAIAQCDASLIFWCAHSAVSPEVRSEYRQAFVHGQVVVPVLLDWTPLASPLAERQAIDLRVVGGFWKNHTGPRVEEVARASRRFIEFERDRCLRLGEERMVEALEARLAELTRLEQVAESAEELEGAFWHRDRESGYEDYVFYRTYPDGPDPATKGRAATLLRELGRLLE